MHPEKRQPRTCPICGATYYREPALSRKDNRTEICPDCGILESLEAIGCSPEDRQHILAKIKEYTHLD